MNILNLLIDSLNESINIIIIIFGLMILVEYLVLKYQKNILKLINKNKLLSYIISSFFGIIPGCVGTFAMDSLYMSGLIGFGGIVAVMIATSGDEAFLILSMATKGEISFSIVITLMAILFLLGILGAIFADIIKKKYKIKLCTKCKIVNHQIEEFKLKHFFKEHVYEHIFKKHIWKIFIWVFFAIFVIGLLDNNIAVNFTGQTMFLVLIIASLVGLLPVSGPNVFLIIMFSNGLVPFSILLANSIIQDGHGLLPLLGYSVEDSIMIKIFNFIFGLTVGITLLLVGF